MQPKQIIFMSYIYDQNKRINGKIICGISCRYNLIITSMKNLSAYWLWVLYSGFINTINILHMYSIGLIDNLLISSEFIID